MFKRLFWLSVGLVAGSTASFWLKRRMRQTIARYAPERLADDVTARARLFGADLRDAAREGRAAMQERERWIREGEVPGQSGPTERELRGPSGRTEREVQGGNGSVRRA